MNIIYRLTLRHLLENKKRSIVTILGIATSTALISAILLGVFSFFNFFGYISVQTSGSAHASFDEVSRAQYQALLKDKSLKSVGLRELDEEKTGVRLITDTQERYKVGNIEHATMGDYSMSVVSDYDGTLPSDSSEIAVEEQFLKDNGLDLKVGDTLTFEEGYRYIDDDLEGFSYLGGNYRSDEHFEKKSVETCTITAILHGNRPTKDWDILRGLDEDYYPSQDKAQVFIMLDKCDSSAIRQVKDLAKKYGIEKYTINTEYMLSRFAFEGSGGSYKSFFVMLGIALAIVIGTSIILIFNSIGMSLTERMRYLGMLASVGATARQKRFSIYYEGFVLGMVGIPLGLLFGYIETDQPDSAVFGGHHVDKHPHGVRCRSAGIRLQHRSARIHHDDQVQREVLLLLRYVRKNINPDAKANQGQQNAQCRYGSPHIEIPPFPTRQYRMRKVIIQAIITLIINIPIF